MILRTKLDMYHLKTKGHIQLLGGAEIGGLSGAESIIRGAEIVFRGRNIFIESRLKGTKHFYLLCPTARHYSGKEVVTEREYVLMLLARILFL